MRIRCSCPVKSLPRWSWPGLALIQVPWSLLFFRSSAFRRQTRLVSSPFAEISDVEANERRSPITKRGVLIVSRSMLNETDEYIFEHIPGGEDRAKQIRSSIMRQIRSLPARSDYDPTDDQLDEPHPGDEEPLPHTTLMIDVGRGVSSYVNGHAGRLYVWGNPAGAFEWMKASTERPEGVEFVPFVDVTAFQLFVDQDLLSARRLRLARRRWPRAGIVVDTGLVVG